jgi:hypothetical protein
MLKNLHGHTVVYLKMGVPVNLFFWGINVSEGCVVLNHNNWVPQFPILAVEQTLPLKVCCEHVYALNTKMKKMNILVSVIQPSRFKHSFSGFCWDLEKSPVCVFVRFVRWMKGDVVPGAPLGHLFLSRSTKVVFSEFLTVFTSKIEGSRPFR